MGAVQVTLILDTDDLVALAPEVPKGVRAITSDEVAGWIRDNPERMAVVLTEALAKELAL